MRPRTAAVGIVACVLLVAAFDVPAGGEDPGGPAAPPRARQRPALHCTVQPRGSCTVGLTESRAPVADVAECARAAGLPPPPKVCAKAPCGWVMNVSCSMPGGPPCWRTLCEVPFEKRDR